MKKSEIITAIIAIYGAVLSTVVTIKQWLGDRPKVRLVVRRNMEVYNVPKYAGMTLTVITITNIGRRPVTITAFGAFCLHPHKSMAGLESQPQLPIEIRDGQYITSYWPQDDFDLSRIDYWYAEDSHHRSYRLRQAPRIEHWKSVLRYKRRWRENKKLHSS